MRKRLPTVWPWLTVLLTLSLLAPASAQDSAAGALLTDWIQQTNEAADEELAAWLNQHMAPEFLAQVPIEQMLAMTGQLRGLGTLELGAVEGETDDGIQALLSSESGTWLRATMRIAGDPPQIIGFQVQPAAAPGSEPDLTESGSLQEMAAAAAEGWDLPGVAIAWARLGEEPVVAVAGVRAAGGNDAVMADDAFHIGSITKSVTSAALGALVEETLLAWDATLSELLPGVTMNDAYADVTLYRLVRHRGGIPQHMTFNDEQMSRLNGLPGTPTEQRGAYVAEIMVEEPLDTDFHYSNAGYATAGYIGELASGMSWEQLVTSKVFEPLGLASCGIGWPATPEHPDQPRGHYGGQGARVPQRLDQYELGAFMAPAGDVHCSVADLARYGLAHLAGLKGQDGFLQAATIQQLHEISEAGAPYGAGWGVDPESGQHRHNGSAGTFYSYLTIDPEAEVVVAFLTNAGPQDGERAGRAAAAAILERVAEPAVR